MNTFRCIVKGTSSNSTKCYMTIDVKAAGGIEAVDHASAMFKDIIGYSAKSATCRILKPKAKKGVAA